MTIAKNNGNPQGCFYIFYSVGTMMVTRTKQQMEILHLCTNKNCNNKRTKKTMIWNCFPCYFQNQNIVEVNHAHLFNYPCYKLKLYIMSSSSYTLKIKSNVSTCIHPKINIDCTKKCSSNQNLRISRLYELNCPCYNNSANLPL
jgi:hypothetical protein